jgi:hypothetical protein
MTGLSEALKRALALADNKIATNAGYDRAMLAAELGKLAVLLPEIDLSMEITGFEPAEIDSLLGDLSDPDLASTRPTRSPPLNSMRSAQSGIFGNSALIGCAAAIHWRRPVMKSSWVRISPR